MAVGTAPVSAQALLPPYEITTSVRSMGLEPISRPVRHGARYVLRAIDGRGAEVTVAADALNGRILFVRPVGYGPGPVYAGRPYEGGYPPDYDPGETVPPRGTYDRLPRNPGEPSVIYAPRGNYNGPVPPARVPTAVKPPAPKVASKATRVSKPSAPPPVSEPTDTAPAELPSGTAGNTSSPPPDSSALAVPPVQSFE
jgi:hypothetical protein